MATPSIPITSCRRRSAPGRSSDTSSSSNPMQRLPNRPTPWPAITWVQVQVIKSKVSNKLQLKTIEWHGACKGKYTITRRVQEACVRFSPLLAFVRLPPAGLIVCADLLLPAPHLVPGRKPFHDLCKPRHQIQVPLAH